MRPTTSTHDWLAGAPADAAWAEQEAAKYRALTVDQRMDALRDLGRLMDELLAGREPAPDGEPCPFWMHWKDPHVGRPR